MRRTAVVTAALVGLALVGPPAVRAQVPRVGAGTGAGAGASAAVPRQREADGYTRYELLDPATHAFRILYEVTAATPGATAYLNPIRPGSVASDEQVLDRATGRPLRFGEVGADVAHASGIPNAAATQRYIRVQLARPVPADGGGGRVQINKTYTDAASYGLEGDHLRFARPLGVKRNAVVLPAGWVLVTCNYPSQIITEADGRTLVSFWNNTPAEAPLVITARRAALTPGATAHPLDERAHQSRNIVYYLKAPETHAFSLTHDYTEARAGEDHYVNIVRAGSTVSEPSGRNLDTGATLTQSLVRGPDAIRRLEPGARDLDAATVAVVFRYPALKAGETARLRFAETYTDPSRYGVENGELTWHRSLGRADNAVVLPAGWAVTGCSIPATLSRLPDGRARLDFLNGRPDEIDVLLTARREQPAAG